MTGAQFNAGFANLPDYLGQHVLLSLSAMVLGLAISLPLAVAASRIAWLRGWSLAIASIVQTIPGLALLALFYPLLVIASGFTTATFGFGFRALGFLPAMLALTLYSILPVLRNTITGLGGIDRAIPGDSQREIASGACQQAFGHIERSSGLIERVHRVTLLAYCPRPGGARSA